MAIDLYYMPMSAPCRSVIMVAKELNITLNLKVVDLMKGEHLEEAYVKINPQHCIPTIVDTETNFTLWESRAILTYLVNKFAPGNSLYPTDARQRAEVDRLLYFDIGTLYKAIGETVYPVMFKGQAPNPENEQTLKDKLALLETQLTGKKWVAGDDMTVADFAIYTSLGMVDVYGMDISSYSNIAAWRGRIGGLSYNKEVNEEPLEQFKAWMESQKAEKK